MKKAPAFATEADLVQQFCAEMAKLPRKEWTIYPESGGFDLLLVQRETGIQLGLEAKLSLNLKVVTQALPGWHREDEGPDYRGVLVPEYAVQHGMSEIVQRLGIGVIAIQPPEMWGPRTSITLPDEMRAWSYSRDWHPWLPTRRCEVPDYVPDVIGGKPSPVQLTDWKVRAIKLLILLDRRGFVTRADLKHFGLSPSRWTCPGGYLAPKDGAFVRYERTPDFRRDHPTNTAQIEADFDKWAPPPSLRQPALGGAA